MYLELSGFDVLQAADGLAALAKATSCRPDIVILDVSLPRLDGLAVTRRLIPREPQLPSRWLRP